MKLRYALLLAVTVPVAAAAIAWFWLLHTEPGARFLWQRAEAALGGALSAARVDGNLGSGLTLVDVRYRDGATVVAAARAGFAVDIDLLPPSVRLSNASVVDIDVQLPANEGKDDEPPGDVGAIIEAVKLPVWLFVDDLEIRRATVQSAPPAEPIVIDRLFVAGRWRESIHIDRLEAALPAGSADVTGRIDLWRPFRLSVDGRLIARPSLEGPDDELTIDTRLRGVLDTITFESTAAGRIGDFAPFDAALAGSVSSGRIDVSTFEIDSEDLSATGNGSIGWAPDVSITGDVALAHANVHRLVDKWPAEHPLTGSLTLAFAPGNLELSNTRLAIHGTDASLTASAQVDTESGRVAADLDWRSLTWPVAAEQPEISSSVADVRVTGTPDDWQIDGRISLAAPGVDEGEFRLTGGGSRESARFDITDSRILGGRVRGDVALAWVDSRPWSVAVDVADIDTGALLPKWPGSITGRITASGRARERSLDAQLDGISGTLRGRAFAANGGLSAERDAVTVRQLKILHAGSEFLVDGNLYSETGMRFKAQVANLGDFVADAFGAVDATGVLSLGDRTPFLNVDATAAEIGWRDLRINSLAISDRLEERSGIDVEFAADSIVVGDERLAEPRIRITADRSSQSIAGSVRYAEFQLALSLAGNVDDWNDIRLWAGSLDALEADLADGTRVRLEEPAAIRVAKDRVSLERICLTDPDATRLCASIDLEPQRRFALTADVEALPLATVNRYRDTGFDFDQQVEGQLRWQQVIGERASGNGEIRMSPGRIVSRDRPGLAVTTETAEVAFDIEGGKLLRATFSLPMGENGDVDGRFRVLDVTNPAASDIEGSLTFNVRDVGFVSVLSPLMDSASGSLRGDIDIGGTLSAPSATGRVAWKDGAIAYLPLGLELADVAVDLTLEPDRRLDVAGTFRAGPGQGSVTATGSYAGDSAPAMNIAIRGDRLTVIDVPDLSAIANVDLNVGIDDTGVALGGVIVVPHARVRPANLPSTRATVSDDVVIVAGELPGKPVRERSSTTRISGTLDVALGDDVRVDLKVASATVTGAATFSWHGDSIPTATGRYDLAGDIEAFGQVLKIVDGGVRFPNVPANNPQLRIRAEREIFGNSQFRAAGVLVGGTLARPTLEAYSVPATTEERALTMLVTGSDFNYGQGVGAIDFGTYIAPRLFLSYGVGLFDRDNVISARYDLARGFGIKATSGQRDSGVDLIYRFER